MLSQARAGNLAGGQWQDISGEPNGEQAAEKA